MTRRKPYAWCNIQLVVCMMTLIGWKDEWTWEPRSWRS